MQKDLTQGAEWRVILRFSLPMMGSMLLQTLYTLVDSVIVGNFIGARALGAVGVTGSIVWLTTMAAAGVGTGASIAVSQYVGARQQGQIKSTLATALLGGGLLSLVLSVLFIALSQPLISGFLQTPAEMLPDSLAYFRWMCVGIPFQMLYNVTYGVLRAHGDSKGAIWFLLVAAVLNLVLDCVFVIVFGWGVLGAALATVISQAGSALAALVYMARLFPSLRLGRGEWRISGDKVRLLTRLSVPVVLQSSVTAIGFVVLQRLVNSFGAASIEGFTAMQKVENLMHIPGNAFNAAIASFAGQNVGAGNLQRVKRGYKATVFMSLGTCVVLAVVATAFGSAAIGLFNVQGEALRRGVEHLNLLALFIVFTNLNHVTAGLLQGTGDVRVPAMASFINLSIRVVSAYIMAQTVIDYRSIYYSLPLAWITACAITQVRYRSGAWRDKAIIRS